MKKIIFAGLLLASCSNKKAELVDQIKAYEDSVALARVQMEYLPIDQVKDQNVQSKLIRYKSILDSLKYELMKQ